MNPTNNLLALVLLFNFLVHKFPCFVRKFQRSGSCFAELSFNKTADNDIGLTKFFNNGTNQHTTAFVGGLILGEFMNFFIHRLGDIDILVLLYAFTNRENILRQHILRQFISPSFLDLLFCFLGHNNHSNMSISKSVRSLGS